MHKFGCSSAEAFSLVSTTAKTTAISKEISTAAIVTVDKNISLLDPASVFKPEPKSIAVKGTLGIRTPWQTAQGDQFIELADRKVYLRDLLAGSDIDGQLTQLDGKFDLKVPKPGRYAICWSVENISQTLFFIIFIINSHYCFNFFLYYIMFILYFQKPWYIGSRFFKC